ncbi:acyltransferase family protein [Rhizobium sp. BR 362]|uniref:acyltransferase family protein n=1 Tax=Rhizobium sp. BR 362 TaxID=3040670 RepID=UPI002F4292BE
MQRNEELDRLRAVAIAMVMFRHSDALTLHQFPILDLFMQNTMFNLGVILFFSISGYVISATLIPEIDTGEDIRATFLRFWIRRITRISPMAVLWAGIPLACCVWFNSSGAFGSIEKNIPAAVASIFNYFNFYTITPHGDIYGVFWSLSLEEQFYLAFPFLLVAVKTSRSRLILLATIWPILLALPSWLGAVIPLFPIGLGVMIYIAEKEAWLPKLRIGMPYGVALACFLIIALPLAPAYVPRVVHEFIPVMPIVAASLVYLAIQRQQYILPFSAWRIPLRWIGTRSYGLYLIHYPIFLLAIEIGQRFPLANTTTWRSVIALLLTAILAEICFRFFETPIRNWGRSLSAQVASEKTPTTSPASSKAA